MKWFGYWIIADTDEELYEGLGMFYGTVDVLDKTRYNTYNTDTHFARISPYAAMDGSLKRGR